MKEFKVYKKDVKQEIVVEDITSREMFSIMDAMKAGAVTGSFTDGTATFRTDEANGKLVVKQLESLGYVQTAEAAAGPGKSIPVAATVVSKPLPAPEASPALAPTVRIKVEDIARACHEANRVLCQAVGDHSQRHWAEAQPWQRESMIKGVEYRLANPKSTPKDLHESWCKEKIQTGWQYGLVKSADQKTHPCLVPHSMLPPEQQAKDFVFAGIVDAMKPLL